MQVCPAEARPKFLAVNVRFGHFRQIRHFRRFRHFRQIGNLNIWVHGSGEGFAGWEIYVVLPLVSRGS